MEMQKERNVDDDLQLQPPPPHPVTLRAGFSEDEIFYIDELLGVMDQKSEFNNEAVGYPMQDAWYENKQDVSQNESIYMQQDDSGVAPNFGFDFLEGGA
ncbi:hypothetical protein CTI12_AA610440 [Artemisia annua]|uniref:Uncharacterized protein n=1 Tax=Artemisia annua TaxID=35608 RepID=A0A2U1KEY6_ARTAN|nr:hypothetical protein CTI12_AA610440 [Artemisia annua]